MPPPAAGLTSAEACQRLSQDLQSFITSQIWTLHWRRDIRRVLPTIVTSLYTLLAGVLLVAACATGDGEYRSRTALLAALLLFLFSVNLLLVCRDVYLHRTWHTSQLRFKAKALLNKTVSALTCPWRPSSYPPQRISTLRSQVTVQGLRDGVLVNIPITLLVAGDVIQAYPGLPLPASVTLLDSKSGQLLHTQSFLLGEVPQLDLFQSADDGGQKKTEVTFTPDDPPLWFMVTKTPIVTILEESLQVRRSPLEREMRLALSAVAYIVIPAVFLITLLINLIRFYTLSEYFPTWQEVVVSWPVYVVFPLLSLPLQLMWLVMSAHSVARISLLLESSSQRDVAMHNTCGRSCTLDFWITVRQFFRVVFRPSRYLLPEVVDFFGNLTALCAVDKEYLLTGGLPTPEKVFFLRGKKSFELTAVNSKSSLGSSQRKHEGDKSQRSSGFTEQSVSKGAENTGVANENNTEEEEEEKEREEEEEEEEREGTDRQGGDGSGGEVEYQDLGEQATCRPEEQGSAPSSPEPSESDADPVEIITEMLDITPNPDTLSGLDFDDPNWTEHLNSLKPIGVNTLTTSHLFQSSNDWPPFLTSTALREYLHKTQCACSLGDEVGVKEYAGRLEQEKLLYLLSEAVEHNDQTHVSTLPKKTFFHTGRSDLIQPHLVSAIFKDTTSGIRLLMSRGSGDVVAWCCCDFWDGKDLQPVGEMERMAILDFFARRSLTSHCIALSYNPLLENVSLPLFEASSDPLGLFVPYSMLNKCLSSQHFSVDELLSKEEEDGVTHPAEHFSPQLSSKSVLELMCNQVFLGMVSLQYHPKADVVDLIQALRESGIRFIHFTAESELRGKIFAEKLGLEAGWNCHISLAPGTEDESLSYDDSSSSSTNSSLHSVINAFQTYIRAKLPKGIEEVRPHLADVDNVPLLVPLFTDCTPNAVREMIQIMQESGEVVLCMGNPWVRENLPIFAQAEIGLSLVPSPEDMETRSLYHHSGLTELEVSSNKWPSPLDLAVALNSFTCEVHLPRDADVSLRVVVRQSRHLLGCMQRCLLFGFGCSLSLAVLLLLSNLFFLPPPLSGGHVYWLTLFIIPSLSLSILSVRLDPDVKKRMPDRKKISFMERFFLLLYFMATYLPSTLLFVILFSGTLGHLCRAIPSSGCHPLLGNENASSNSSESAAGWLVENRQGLVLAQDCMALLFTFTFLAISLRFIHRTEPLWRLWKYISWQYITVFVLLAVLQVVYFVLSQIVETLNSQQHGYMIWSVSDVPVYVWVFLVLWPPVQLLLQELLKWCDRRQFMKTQRRLRLSFETKLGMNSPF